ncbi:MAG: bacillithiol biosynthesis cysteine-adding enzyme BshC [Trueperaceae bacterium]
MASAPPPFVTHYLKGELAAFFSLPVGDTVAAMARPLDRPRAALADALRQDAKRLSAPVAVHDSLDRLAHPESRVVVTGQQPGLLLGPAYTLSKAMSAIRLARRLDSEERPAVPVFWVAGQDHDTEEIDHALLLDGEEQLQRIALELPSGAPSGRLPYRLEWGRSIIRGLARVSGRPEHLAEATALVEEASAAAESYADLFSALLYRLLGDEGLILLDPTRSTLAPFFGDVLKRELSDPLASVGAIVAAGEELQRRGFDPQLGRGREATNLFLEEDEEGVPRRQLLRYDGSRFHTANRSYARADLESVLCEEPARLTPAAGLRPTTQDAVLPTAAFVVGPGELRYMAQLRGVYEQHEVPMPLVWPRATSVVLEPPTRRILERYGLDYESYSAQRGEILDRVLLTRHGHGEAFEEALARLESEGEELHHRVAGIDPTLQGTVERGKERFTRTISLLRGKAAEALARQDVVTTRQFARLEAQLFPAGVPQERCLTPFSFFLKFGCGPMMTFYREMGVSGEYLLKP